MADRVAGIDLENEPQRFFVACGLEEHVDLGLDIGREQPLDELADGGFGLRPDEPVDDAPVLEGEDRRDRLHLERLRDGRVLVDVDLGQHDLTLGLVDHLFEDRAERLARPAPRRPQVDDDRGRVRGLHDVVLERRIGYVDHRALPNFPLCRGPLGPKTFRLPGVPAAATAYGSRSTLRHAEPPPCARPALRLSSDGWIHGSLGHWHRCRRSHGVAARPRPDGAPTLPVRAHRRRPLQSHVQGHRHRRHRVRPAPSPARPRPRHRPRHGPRVQDRGGARPHQRTRRPAHRAVHRRQRQRLAVLRDALRRRVSCCAIARPRSRCPCRYAPPRATRSSTRWPTSTRSTSTRSGLGDLGRKDGYIARQLKRWRMQFHDSKTREIPEIDEVHDLLVTRIPEQQGSGIVHGDYRLDNCIFNDDGAVLRRARLGAVHARRRPRRSRATPRLLGRTGRRPVRARLAAVGRARLLDAPNSSPATPHDRTAT